MTIIQFYRISGLGLLIDASAFLVHLVLRSFVTAGLDPVTFAQQSSWVPINLLGAVGAAWQPSTDALAGGTSTAELTIVEGGANDSATALAVAGELTDAVPFAWAGTIFMPGATPFAPFDLSSKPILHFWAKGDARDYRVQLFCANLGQIPVEQPFAVTDEWQAFTFALNDFGGCDTSGVQAIVFSTGPMPGEFAFQIDEVSLQQP